MNYRKKTESFPRDPLQALVFASLEREGEAALRLNESLKKDPRAEVPEEVRRRCRAVIQTAAGQPRTSSSRKPMGHAIRLAAVAALLLLVCACAAALGLDRLFLRYLGVSDEGSSLLGETAVTVEQSHTYENGWTISVRQAMADRYSAAVLFQAKAPEGTRLPQEGTPIYLNAGFDLLDSDGAAEPTGAFGFDYWSLSEEGSNALSLITTQISLAGSGSLLGKTLSVSPYNLTSLPVDFRENPWACTFVLPAEDPGIDRSIGHQAILGDSRLTLDAVYVSPITLALSLDAPVGFEFPDADQWLHQAFLTTSKGKTIDLSRVYNWSADESGRQQYCFRPEEILIPEEIVSLNLWGQTFPLT